MKKLHINRFVIAYILVFGSLAAIGTYVEIYKPQAAQRAIEAKQYFSTDLTYYDLPRITMNLKGAEKTSHVHIDISLEVSKKDAWRLNDFQSRITDRIITFMTKQQAEDLHTAKEIAWLHRDLLKVINTSNQPVPVHDIVFRELVIM